MDVRTSNNNNNNNNTMVSNCSALLQSLRNAKGDKNINDKR